MCIASSGPCITALPVANKAIVVDIPDVFLQSWAIYYMRDVNAILPSPVGYLAMPNIGPFLARARSVSSLPIAGRLHMGPDRDAIWSDGDFSVVPTDMPQITGVSNPNGVEVVDGGQFVWVGPDPLSLDVIVPRKGRYVIKAAQFVPGPSLPGKLVRTVKMDLSSSNFTIDIGPDTAGIPVELPERKHIGYPAWTIAPSCVRQPATRGRYCWDSKNYLFCLKNNRNKSLPFRTRRATELGHT